MTLFTFVYLCLHLFNFVQLTYLCTNFVLVNLSSYFNKSIFFLWRLPFTFMVNNWGMTIEILYFRVWRSGVANSVIKCFRYKLSFPPWYYNHFTPLNKKGREQNYQERREHHGFFEMTIIVFILNFVPSFIWWRQRSSCM